MSATGERPTRDRDDSPTGRLPAGRSGQEKAEPTVLDQMGGPMGFVHSTVPVLVSTGLGVARVVMGIPLTVVAALVVVRAFRRSTKRLIPSR